MTCTSSASFNLQDQPFGSAVSWVIKQNGYTRAQGSGTTAQASNLTNGDADVDFTISFNCGINSIIKHKDFWVGRPDMPTTMPSGYPTVQLGLGALLTVRLSETHGASGGGINWWCTGSIVADGATTNRVCVFEAIETGIGNFYVTTGNNCGTSPVGGGMVNVSTGGGGQMLLIYPNPADDYVEISIEESKLAENKIDEYEVRIYNSMNIMVSQIRTRKPTLRINTRQFINGIYTVHFITGDKLQVEQLVISH